jgi:hypothetical protein
METITSSPIVGELEASLAEVEERVVLGYTLADAIREGSAHSEQLLGDYTEGDLACALAAGYFAAKARGYIS